MSAKCFARLVVLTFLVFGLAAAPATAGDENDISGKTGLGYQGMAVGSFLNGISLRSWALGNVGLEGNLFYGGIDVDIENGSFTADADLYLFEGKAMYAFIVKENSRFYAGGKFGWGRFDVNLNDAGVDGDIFSLGAFIGSEWNFQGIPELGFNFDVGYSYNWYDDEIMDTDIDISLDGISATFGIHYYF